MSKTIRHSLHPGHPWKELSDAQGPYAPKNHMSSIYQRHKLDRSEPQQDNYYCRGHKPREMKSFNKRLRSILKEETNTIISESLWTS